jgi:hypothetical protein
MSGVRVRVDHPVSASVAEQEHFREARAIVEARGLVASHVLGRGGLAVVFAAKHAGEDVAVKVAEPWPSDDDTWSAETTTERLRVPRLSDDARSLRVVPPPDVLICNRVIAREFQRLAEARDEAVVKGINAFTEGGRAGYSMTRVEGEALVLEPGPALAALARVLYRLHSRGWPHGDLKPRNVRVRGGEHVTLIDPLPVGLELTTPAWTHMNFLVSSPLVNSADPRDRRMEYRYRDLVALALMASQAFTGERPWGHEEVARMLDRGVSMGRKREELAAARDRLKKIVPKLPGVLKPLVALALDPGLWPEEGPTFAAYLQARPFETRCDALATLDIGTMFTEACR